MNHDDFIKEFIDALAAHGQPPANPADIIGDDQWHRYLVAGDKKPDARYQLAVEDNFAFGRFIYFKDNEPHSWHSKANIEMTAEQRKEFKEIVAQRKKDQKKRQKEEWAVAAEECRLAWDSGQSGPHPYLEKKGISGDGTRVADLVDSKGKTQKGVLLIPVWKDGKLTSLQRIYSNGFKAFWEGGDVSGGYTAFVGADDDKSTIIITEGFATGASIKEAVPQWPVIVAFNAGNLMEVAKVMRKKYKQARIVIAADNDQWTFNNKRRIDGIKPSDIAGDDERWAEWRNEKRLSNVGMDKAMQVGVKIGAHVIYPNIPEDNKDKNTDFNDLHAMSGIEAVKARILDAAPASARSDRDDASFDSLAGVVPPHEDMPPEAYNYEAVGADEMSRLYGVDDEDLAHDEEPAEDLFAVKKVDDEEYGAPWREDLYCNDDGQPRPNSLRNASIFINHHPRYRGMFCYDEFAQEKVIARCPPWDKKPEKFAPRTVRDEDYTLLAIDMEPRGISLNLNNLRKVVDSIIASNKQNPAQEYFKNLVWDGTPRLNTWLRSYCGCLNDDPEYLAAVGRKWLVAAVKRIMQPGCKFDHILIFEGDQSLGKSPMLRELATIHGKDYFDDTIAAKDLPNPSTVPKLQGCIIIELSEMAGFEKLSASEAKQIISTQSDRIVRKYENDATRLPRKFVFAGTINEYSGYLNDPTGNKRYWPVKCSAIDLEAIRRDKEQLWAEAAHYWKNGEKLWLDDPELYKKAQHEAERRLNQHPWQGDIEQLTQQQTTISYEDIWGKLSISDRSRRTKASQDEIAKIMTSLGYSYKRRQINGERIYLWERKEVEPIIGNEQEEISW